MHSLANTSEPEAGEAPMRFVLDAPMSRFKVQAFAGGLLSAFGHSPVIAIREFSGDVQYNPQSVEQSSDVPAD